MTDSLAAIGSAPIVIGATGAELDRFVSAGRLDDPHEHATASPGFRSYGDTCCWCSTGSKAGRAPSVTLDAGERPADAARRGVFERPGSPSSFAPRSLSSVTVSDGCARNPGARPLGRWVISPSQTAINRAREPDHRRSVGRSTTSPIPAGRHRHRHRADGRVNRRRESRPAIGGHFCPVEPCQRSSASPHDEPAPAASHLPAAYKRTLLWSSPCRACRRSPR